MKFRRTAVSGPVVATIVIMAVLLGSALTYIYVSGLKPGSSVNTQPTNTASTQSGVINPTIGITVNTANSLASSTMSETNPAYNFWSCTALGGQTWGTLSALSTTTNNIPTSISSFTKGTQKTMTLGPQDLNCGYGVLVVYAGDTTYTDVSNVLASSSPKGDVIAYKWVVGLTLGRYDLAVQLSYAPTILGQPNYQLSPNLAVTYTNPEFVQTTIGSVTVTNAYTSNEILSIGTAANTVTQVKWTVGATTSTDAVAVAKMTIVDNDSTTAPIATTGALSFGDNLPADQPALTGTNFQYNHGGQLTGILAGNIASLGYSSASITHQYQYWPGLNGLDPTQLANAIILTNPAQSLGDTTISVPVTTSFASGSLSVGLSVTLIAGNGAYTLVATSSVLLGSAATG